LHDRDPNASLPAATIDDGALLSIFFDPDIVGQSNGRSD
jgi:hypothetical protein